METKNGHEAHPIRDPTKVIDWIGMRSFYSDAIDLFVRKLPAEILGELVLSNYFPLEVTQRDSWTYQIELMQKVLGVYHARGKVYFELSVPRLGKRIDVVVVIDRVVFVLEFKVGESGYSSHGHDQVWDYALDLKNFHETSHHRYIVPVLIATAAKSSEIRPFRIDHDRLLHPTRCNGEGLATVLSSAVGLLGEESLFDDLWERGRYCPTPTIIEAAMALYNGHGVENISRSDASAVNLTDTSELISRVIRDSRENSEKSICFVTGVPGAGKTLVGLNIATRHMDNTSDLYSVFLSGNGPLVSVLCEALARDRVEIAKSNGQKLRKGQAKSEVQSFIQNIHHFRDDCLANQDPPIEHVVLFDEAQRAWNLAQTASFMKRKKGHTNFAMSEPEFLISCMDRHKDWAVVVCLVGGGQEINTGEAGIAEWIDSLNRSYPEWQLYISDKLTDSEYGVKNALDALPTQSVHYSEFLHLSVSMRSYRAERVSLLVKQLLDLDIHNAQSTAQMTGERYPIYLTRNLDHAKAWLRSKARGSERFGIIASSQAQRLKPHAIDVRSPVDPVHWFLDGKLDVRSSYFLEDVATEFQVQGLELDWSCVTWDADLRCTGRSWEYKSFCGDRWNRINQPARQKYLLNAYRVLLTRARQGMVIFVPPGSTSDHTRLPEFYDGTYDFLHGVGLPDLPLL